MPVRLLTILSFVYMSGISQTGYSTQTENPKNTPDNQIIFCYDPWQPMHKADENGNPEGYIADRVKLIFSTEMKLTLKSLELPWLRATKMVENGECHFFVTTPTDKRKVFSIPAKDPILISRLVMITNKRNDNLTKLNQVKNLDDLQKLNLTGAAVNGNGWWENHITKRGIKSYPLSKFSQLPSFIADGKADFTIVDIYESVDMLKDKTTGPGLAQADPYLSENPLHVMFSKKTPKIGGLDLPDLIKKFEEAQKQVIERGLFTP